MLHGIYINIEKSYVIVTSILRQWYCNNFTCSFLTVHIMAWNRVFFLNINTIEREISDSKAIIMNDRLILKIDDLDYLRQNIVLSVKKSFLV